ncbi:MAG: hypothetical protein V1733_09090 [bacterium]
MIALFAVYFIVQSVRSERSIQKNPVKVDSKEKLPRSVFLPYLADLQWMKLRNPQTDEIPAGIRSRELAFVSGLTFKESFRGQSWNWRGPNNIGGRMLCIAVDLDNEDRLLAGSAS